jgi:hypothetical protein
MVDSKIGSENDSSQRVERNMHPDEEYCRDLGNRGLVVFPAYNEAGHAARDRTPSITEQAMIPSLGDLKSSLDMPFQIER